MDGKIIASFDTYLLAEKRVSMNTFYAYKKDISQLMDFLESKKLSLKVCSTSDLKKFISSLRKKGLGSKSISRKISTLKLFFKFLKIFEIDNVAELLIFPKLEKSLPSYLTNDEVEILLQTAREDNSPRGIRNKVIIYLLYASGMRVSELINLTTDQIHFDTGFIRILGKGNKERSIPLPDVILKFISLYIENARKEFIHKNCAKSDYLFISLKSKGKPLTRQSIWNILKNLLSHTGIKKKISPHSLRHSIATHLLSNGANLRSLQMLLGHEQISTVQIYTHLDKTEVRKIYDKAHPRS